MDNLLVNKYPDIAKQWDTAKNNNIQVDKITYGSQIKVWWLCEKGHSWKAVVKNRTKGNCGCPICRKGNLEETGLVLAFPEIAKQWHPVKNSGLDINEFTKGSKQKVWWQCEKKHEWQSMVSNRIKGTGCPICKYGHLQGEKKLVDEFPELAKEWHPTKNGDLKLDTVSYGSKNKAWWLCEEGHEWQSTVNNRTKGSGCPVCKKRYVEDGNSLQDKFPEISKQWHPTKNGFLKPSEVSFKASRIVWWFCDKGHEWQQSVQNKTDSPNMICRLCFIKDNSVGIKYPDLLKEWDYDKNENSPFEIFTSSQVRVYWKCKEGHTRFTSPSHKIKYSECPSCVGRAATPDDNFGVKCPELIKFWDYDRNDCTPYEVIVGSNKLIYWKCDKGHKWERKIYHIRSKNQCQVCYLKNNNLEKKFPEIAKEWNYDRNGDLKPSDVTYALPKYVWWECKKGHEWKVQISSRTASDSGCPQCKNHGYSKAGIQWLEEISDRDDIYIQHAANEGEYKIKINGKTFKVDGYCEETNTVYEYLGCLWHFHPPSVCKYNQHKKFYDINPVNKKCNRDLYLNTISRLELIRKEGYRVVSIWECEYLKK